jgi:predicted O-linked N-acetylglucosamine transferase (SPINDLY family)
MLATHDRRHFKIYGYACNPDDGTRYRRFIAQACDCFIDIHDCSNLSAAQRIYDDRIDILVDLSGHTFGNRLQIAALRPAAVQVSYLGLLGSTGASFIDYVITDPLVVPETDATCYTEKPAYLPNCYQANDDKLPIADVNVTRDMFNLPSEGFIYCCFNQPYKIEPHLFDIWMKILRSVDNSVLWLLHRSQLSQDNLRRAAAGIGISPDRLIFSALIPLEQHLARLQLADLALDTYTYNGGATTSNALWAGVPVLASLGQHWVSRMSASALHAIGLPELVTANLDEYRQMAVDLAHKPSRLKALKEKLAYRRLEAPLFNTKLFTTHLEKAYLEMWRRYRHNLAPASFHVQP